jgi:hypothetical protein
MLDAVVPRGEMKVYLATALDFFSGPVAGDAEPTPVAGDAKPTVEHAA